ncbi:AfsR/SARP family transcriptional regulator [Nocardia transvalensis]|uniref:AfsR/SARP family transcriptional regulator n=1 Tax=Nocardia transvalensis TaxID=37333 RepID=UPI0018949AA4|nr:BTAD domain-containing putative transcriptional regulator [Nocardia transvalensis]MBF6329909.1 winged helix-turn-helix domain-containing protein [Nocardia transvalensis]
MLGRRVDLGPPRQCGILAALLAEPGRPLSIEALIDRVWDDEPPGAVRSVVYTYIARLRRALKAATECTGRPVTVSRNGGGYFVDVRPDQIDLSNFRALTDGARALPADDPLRAEYLARALQLWRGEALAGLTSGWARRFSDTLRQLKHETIAEWADAELRAGRHARAIVELRKALLDEPLAEELHERLIRAYYLGGQTAEALRQYDRARRCIADELGADLAPTLRVLHTMILQGRPPIVPGKPPGPAEPRPARRPATRPATAPENAVAPDQAPDLLPMDVLDFGGRDREVVWLDEALSRRADARPILITGGPGVGKTALAVRAAHILRPAFPDGCLYADLRGTSALPAHPGTILTRFLRALGTSSGAIPADLDARAEAYRNRVAGRRILIVLDDAANEEQLRLLLPGGRGSVALMTSRTCLAVAGMCRHTVRELSVADSVEMLCRIVGRARVLGERDAAEELAGYCSGLPSALRIVASRMTSRPHRTFDQLAARLADETNRLDELSFGSMDMRAYIDSSYDRLDRRAARMFTHLGSNLRPGTIITASPGLGFDRMIDAEEALDRLVDAHLLNVVGRDPLGRIQYSMLDVYRIYAAERGRRLPRAVSTASLTDHLQVITN